MLDIKVIKEYTRDLSVLYVEDDVSLMDATHELLGNFFPHLDLAFDGEDGLYKYIDYEKEHGKYYDLIITDINMPKMNGIVMSDKILKINYEQSIVIVTAHNEIDYLFAALKSGVDGFLIKPIQTEKLMFTLFKVAQNISNRKLVESHIAMIEELTIRLDMQNKELMAKNQELE